MTNIILLPNGDAVSTEVIRGVAYYEGKGVMCRDAQTRPLFYIAESDIETGKRIRDLLIKAVKEGRSAEQPDWSFIK